MMLVPFATVSAGKLQEISADVHDACLICDGSSRKAQLNAHDACRVARVCAGKPS